MRFGCILILILILCFTGKNTSRAQNVPAKTDSTKIYRDIEEFSKKRKVTHFIYRLFFRPVDIPAEQKANAVPNIQDQYGAFNGKIIRRIHITSLDPFGYSATDTVLAKQNFLYKIGNKLHIRTQRITVKNLLLIHKNEPFDSLRVKESERLIRSQSYVQAVSFECEENADSIDIDIRVVDKWSLAAEGSVSTSSFRIGLKEKNFWGLGHQFENVFTRNYDEAQNAFSTQYYIPNIRNTYINTTLYYARDEHRSILRSLAVDRPFYSPLAKWAGGFSLLDQHQVHDVPEPLQAQETIKYTVQDYWAGHAWQIFKGSSEDHRTTNLVLNGRFLKTRYRDLPPLLYDTLHVYADENFYLASIGLSRRRYIRDKYLFNFGFIEDVPAGNIYEFTLGYQERTTDRIYTGFRVGSGNYNSWGYLAWHFEYGSFLRNYETEQGVFIAGMEYFTNLIEVGNWHFRQFIKPQYIMGVNRFPYEEITINNENGLRGFGSEAVTGTKKILLTLQTQSYAPWNLLGFRFGPYLIHSLGMLGNQSTGFRNSPVFSQLGAGVLIKNDFLTFNVFQVSIAFYPNIPGDGKNIIKINAVATTNFGLRDYTIGKPGTLSYQ